MQSAVVRSQGYTRPQTTIVGQQLPLLTDVRQTTQIRLTHVAEDVQQGLVWQVIYCLLWAHKHIILD